MIRALKNFFEGRMQHHDIVIFSSFVYLLCAMLISVKNPTLTTLLFLVFLTSIFYHSYPKNLYFRMADWIGSFSIFFFLIDNYLEENIFFGYLFIVFSILLLFTLFNFILSLIADSKSFSKLYNTTHTLWHIFSAFTIILIVLGI